MRVVYERCCGLDVHKRTVTACIIIPEGQESRTFGAMTKDLLQLGDWLIAKGVSHVAMESTGVYWKPVYNVLEGLGLELLVVNAYHIKAVPGRKTDVKDAEWIADLLRHGLLKGSYIPDRPQRELRELVRYRKGIIYQRVQVVNRIQKVLEGANIKLSNVATDIVGLSGRAMLEAMVAGERDAPTLASLARGKLRRKQGDLEEALQGAVGPHQRFLLASLLRHLGFLDEEVRRVDEEVEDRLRPFEDVLQRLDTIPGIGRRAAEQLVAEIGLDMSRFPTAGHLASWAKVCPGNNESAGKRLSGRTGRGNPWLRSTLVESAWPAARSRNTYLSSQYHRLAARRGSKRAIVAVAHTILIIVYHLIKDGITYRELGGNYFDEREREATVRRSVQRLQRLGYRVTVEAA
ncbi:MAG: IS110 family transposase [Dehalococcoidia bacterium]|jgi:transposase